MGSLWIGSWWRTLDSARMAPKRATTLVLLVTISTQVLGEPGVWSALSFFGGNAGKRSTDETQELYPLAEDMEMSSRYEETDYEEYGEEAEARIEPFRRRRKPYRRRRKPKPTSSQDFYSGDYTDRDSGYDAPQQSYDSPAFAESSPSYSGGGGGKDSFNDFLNALAAFLPIGLFLAAIPPNLIVINSTARRKRETEDSLLNSLDAPAMERPILRRIASLGPAMWRTECQAQIFCEMVRLGRLPEGNSVQRMFASAAVNTPDFAANLLGLSDTFQASREGDCSKFKCGQ